ncbi:MAG: sulfite exporter TauE/SafE family protein [Halobacteria archaeon]|nr:sulfite exporter TauE/SafE family protein [Halobacteria archaeon]
MEAIAVSLLAYLLTGAVAGLLAGLLGIGGGLVIVPALAVIFVLQGFPDNLLMHFALGTSLATIVPTSIASLLAHHRRGSVHWEAVRSLTPGIVLGALAGAWLAGQSSSTGLRVLFGCFEVLVALQLAFGRQPGVHRELPGVFGQELAGVLIGAVSSLLGIGGGTLTVPYLRWNGVEIRAAIGTAATCGLPIALAGSAGYVIAGTGLEEAPGLNSGFIYWPALAGIVLASVPMAPLGAALAHRLPRRRLVRIFALVLAVIGVRMVLV